jgi:hypothetical protein
MPEASNNFKLDSDLSQILDPKSDRIQYMPSMPSPTEGDNGEIRVGILYKNKTLMAVKIEGIWYFTEMVSMDKLSANIVSSANGAKVSTRKPHRKTKRHGECIGYTVLGATGMNLKSHTLQTSFTVENEAHKITFDVPPSEAVEIEVSHFLNRYSTSDVGFYASLSTTHASYSKLGEAQEFDYLSLFMSDDESDDEIVNYKFVLTADVLGSVGTTTTLYIAMKTSDSSAINLHYGKYSPAPGYDFYQAPFTIKATAIPTPYAPTDDL